MSEFAQRRKQTPREHLVSPAEPEWTRPRLVRAANSFLVQRQALGNQATQRFAQSCPRSLPSPGLCPLGGICHTCPAPVQAKLTVNEPGDKYEQEADRVAEAVMRMPEPRLQRQVEPEEEERETLQTKPLAAQITPLVQRQVGPEGEEEELVQAKQVGGKTPQTGPGLEAQIRSSRGDGQPLSESARSFFEPRFGHDLSLVRIHTDARTAQTTEKLGASAFTHAHHVYFGAGQYRPETPGGRRLLAHELAHVIQQTGTKNGKGMKVTATGGRLANRQVQRAVSFDSTCDAYPYLKCAINEAVRDARRVVGTVVSELASVVAGRVTSGRIINLLNVHFHVPTPDQIREIHRRFQRLSTALGSPPAFNCLAIDAPECTSRNERGVTGGRSTVCRGGSIDICGMFNNFTCTTRSHVIIHEMAHHELCAAGDIYAGLHRTQYMSLSNVQAMENADSYAQFAEMVDRGSPICRECYLPSGPRPVSD